MKILLTSDVYNVKTNGVATSVRNLYEALVSLGHDVKILTLSNDRESHVDGNIYYVKSASLERVYKGIRMPRSFKNPFLKELIKWKPDIIHSQCEVFSYGYAKKISKKTGAPIVHTYHTMYDDYVGYIFPFKRFGRWFVRKLTKLRLKKVKVIVTPTKKVENTIRKYGLKNEIAVIPSGINLSEHINTLSKEERLESRRFYKIDDDELLLISLGRVANEKNIDEVIKHFKTAHAKNNKLRLMIAGDGPAREGLEKLVSELGLNNEVVFTGMIEPSHVYRYYQLGDIFVSASTSETQGLTYIEAMANGLPLLCKRDECLDGVLLDGENGYFFDGEETFVSSLEKLSSGQVRESFSKKSKELSKSYDKIEFGKNLLKLYNEVLKKHAE